MKKQDTKKLQPENTEKVKKEKKPLSKKAKIWISIGTALVFVVACVGTLLAVLLSPKLRWHGLSIANFDSYVGIGAASFGKSETASAVAYASADGAGKKDMKLAGITKDDMCLEIEFVNDKGKKVKQNANLVLFDAHDYFSFMVFSVDKNQEFLLKNNYRYSYSYGDSRIGYMNLDNEYWLNGNKNFMFILDNITGKIYDMREVAEVFYKTIKPDYKEYLSFTITFSNLEYLGNQPSSHNYLMLKLEISDNSGWSKFQLWQVLFKENNIEVSQKMNSMQYSNFGSAMGSVKYDRFGNTIIYMDTNIRIQKADGKFDTKNFGKGSFKFGANSVLYYGVDSKTYYLNKNGEFEEISFDFEKIFDVSHIMDSFLYKTGNVRYHSFNTNQYGNQYGFENGFNLVKITLDEQVDWKFTMEAEVISFEWMTLAAREDKVYMLKDKKLYVYDMQSKSTTEFESVYEFKNLAYSRVLDQVQFKAVDKISQLEVDGYFDENGAIHIGDFAGVKKGNNRVYVVKPLN